jgi:hypothetical protein
MATAPDPEQSQIRFLDDDESHAFFDAQARRLLNMSGEEFLRRYDAGEYAAEMDGPQHSELAELVILIPFGRKNAPGSRRGVRRRDQGDARLHHLPRASHLALTARPACYRAHQHDDDGRRRRTQ